MFAKVALITLLFAASCASRPDAQSADDHVLTLPTESALILRIDPAFSELPALHFPIENLTNAERYIYVDAGSDRVIDRMIVVQFEHAQEGSDFRFVFPSTPPRQFGDNVYRFGAFVYDDVAAAVRSPDREAGRTRALLESQGFVAPTFWRVARLARVSDSEGLTEVIIFYQENADADYPNGLVGADADGDLPLTGEAREALARRLEATIEPVHG